MTTLECHFSGLENSIYTIYIRHPPQKTDPSGLETPGVWGLCDTTRQSMEVTLVDVPSGTSGAFRVEELFPVTHNIHTL